MHSTEFKELLSRYLANNCTATEKAIVENWYNQHKIENPILLTEEEYATDVMLIHEALDGLDTAPKKMGQWFRMSAAAVVLFTLTTLLYFYFQGKEKAEYAMEDISSIKPGTNKATLTLSDGSEISLSDTKSGEITVEAGQRISKSDDGKIIYSLTTGKKTEKDIQSVQFNTIATPKGGKFNILLPDGTMVWLDAASSLRYPVNFVGNERKVELMGQAYFEVAKNKGKSFKVVTGNQEVQVLGTHFNVNAYSDQPAILTTLLEGSVKVAIRNTNLTQLLKPGQQSALEGKYFQVKEVDLDETIAWKRGFFVFDNDDVTTVLHKLERWYDVEITSEGELDHIKIGGTISRDKNLSEVLRVLQLTRKIKFKTEGRRIIAMP